MEQTKTDPGRKKKKPLRRCGIFFACLLILFLGGLTTEESLLCAVS